ncbi:MAG TPA: extracellular solute-binding protein, partial [Spirochaetia bacterium]|nr:extracellular solute-binding protein [Spirochaetia bacterium]
MNRFRPIAAALIALLALSAFPAFAEKVSITYWQYFYQSKVDLMNQLIENFEKANPDIDVEQVTFPYESYQQKVAAAIPAGEG